MPAALHPKHNRQVYLSLINLMVTLYDEVDTVGLQVKCKIFSDNDA